MATHQLLGTIYDAHNAVLSNVIVQAYDQDFRKQEILGQTRTDGKGNYSIIYNPLRFSAGEIGPSDIFIQVLDAAGMVLGQSDTYFNVADNFVLDFKIGNTPVKSINEFDGIVQKIKPIIERQRVSLGGLEENEEHRDMTFLSSELGESVNNITRINTAFRLSKEMRIAPDVLYALFRMGFPSEINELLQINADSILKALKMAIDENIISSRWNDELESIIKRFNSLTVKQILNGNAEQASTFKKVMGSVLSADQQIIFLNTWIANEDKPEKFWEQLKQQPGFADGNAIEKSRQALQLNSITGNQPELTLQLLKAQEDDEELKSIYGFAKLNKSDWIKQIQKANVSNFPEWVIGATPEEKTESYGGSLETLQKELHPTSYFGARLKQDNSSAFTLKAQLQTFFGKNPDFDLGTKNILKQLEAASFENVTDKDEVKKELKTINRLYKLTDDYTQVNALYSKGLFSSSDIVSKYGRVQFERQFASSIGGKETATVLYKKAVSINNKATALLTAYKMRNDIPIYAIDGASRENPENAEFWEGYYEMFADGELCECEHCQSVYSPAAYFVDMLAFIKREKEEAYEELIRRRPDLDDILLTCKNTNTTLPYIDLVNELLEKKVIQLTNPATTVDDHSFQTEGIAEELAAMPEHISESAYNSLKIVNENSAFSHLLPLDLPLEEMRLFTEKLGWERFELVEAFYGHDETAKLASPELAAELFKFSEYELKIISGTPALQIDLPVDSNGDTDLSIKSLLNKAKLSYIELLQLRETYFLNPVTGDVRLVKIIQPPIAGAEENLLTCNLEKLLISGIDADWMNKMARFVRLWKKIGWDIFDLDRAFTAFDLKDFPATEAAFNYEILLSLSHIERIHRILNIPVREVLTFVANIDTKTYIDQSRRGQPILASLYEQIFRSKTLASLDQSPFKENGEGLSGSLVSYRDVICAGLGIVADDFALLKPEDDEFSLKNLSHLYRNVLLAKALKTSVNELLDVIEITGIIPVNGIWSSGSLVQFLNEFKTFKSTGISTADYQNIVAKKNEAVYTLPVDQALITSVHQTISAMETILADTGVTEIQKKSQLDEKLDLFIQSLTDNAALKTALGAKLSHSHELSVKNEIESYSGETYKEQLLTLQPNELIARLNNLKLLLSDYLYWKTTPFILGKLGFDKEEILWLKTNGSTFKIDVLWADNVNIKEPAVYRAFRNLFYLSKLDKLKSHSLLVTWKDLLEKAMSNQSQTKSDFFDVIIDLFGVSENPLTFLIGPRSQMNELGQFKHPFPQAYLENTKFLIDILEGCKLVDELGGDTEQIKAIIKADVAFEDAKAAKNLLKSKYSNKEWLNIIKPINDQLRRRRRDSLVTWLISNPGANRWQNTDDIYESLLIDVDMGACMVTSRIKQAIGSVQLFIDRCLMNLETTPDLATTIPTDTKKIVLGTEFSEQWNTWRKQYRVWEANRKIFLYPENWIETDLRDDKSPFFKELESQLKQNEVTVDTAKEALIAYLQKLDTVANLEMVGLFNDEETKILHVFGRTQNIPHQYFYRKQQNNVWTDWEKVDVDIEGDHILPVVWNGRLMLFWGMFTEKQQSQDPFITPKAGEPVPLPVTYLEMKLAWSECKNGKWSAKKISKDFCKILLISKCYLPFPSHGFAQSKRTTELKHCFLATTIYQDNLVIKVMQWDNLAPHKLFWKADFIFDSCSSTPKYRDVFTGAFISAFQDINGNYIYPRSGDGLILAGPGVFGNATNSSGSKILNQTPFESVISPIRHALVSRRNSYFFYSNSMNRFIVKSYNYMNDVMNPDIGDFGNQILARRVNIPEGSRAIIFDELENSFVRGVIATERRVTDLTIDESNGRDTPAPYNFLKRNSFTFHTFCHPKVCQFIKTINTEGVQALYYPNVQNQLPIEYFENRYLPEPNVITPYPKEEVDFTYKGSYSTYNWELFFHIPLLIATRLTQNQKFEEARKWFHYIFNPTISSGDDASAKRFWITKPFRKEIEESILSLEDLLNREEFADDLDSQLDNWERNPFNPHAVARLRISAYMRSTVLRYIDNLIQWGDQLFRRDTIESINEATLLYILASNILGKKQEIMPPRAKAVEKSFSGIAEELDRFSNIKDEIESFISGSSGDDAILMPYFCLPKNDYLLKYWDTVADRLFKIRHCMNIEGTVRQLPLFEPPIDPALLVRAKEAGLDLNTVLNDQNATLPNYRFQVMLQQANELCNDVKSLGSSLLSTLEKKDGEEIALLRSAHELRMLEMIKDVKEKQREEAKENLNSLNNSKNLIQSRKDYFEGKDFMNVAEKLHVASLATSGIFQGLAAGYEAYGGLLLATPDTMIGPFSSGFTIGGSYYGAAARANASIFGLYASSANTVGAIASAMGSFQQRMDDWKFQSKSAELELKQIDKQIIAAEIRLAIGEKEIENHSLQIEQSKEVNDYMRSKFTNEELYDWMVGQLSTVYFQSYQLAYSTAKKAEKCLQYELGLDGPNYVQFGYWDSLKKGLLSGEKLQFDLRRLENAYLEANKREYEIVKHVSLFLLDPLAIVQLWSTGACTFEIPEALYDMDFAGHYFRRLKSVSISLPCIAGPYTSVSASLKLTKSQCRIKNDYLAPGSLKEYGNGQSIATSNAQNDSGIFELNFRDDRYLPFEGAGAVSSWELELPTEIRQFDYNTISDVIIHVKYTSRDGGPGLKTAVNAALRQQLLAINQSLEESGLHVALNLRHDLPNEWNLLKKKGSIELTLDTARLPYMVRPIYPEVAETVEIESVMFIAKLKGDLTAFTVNINGEAADIFTHGVDKLKLWTGLKSDIVLDFPFTLSLSDDDRGKLDELLLVVKYKFKDL